MHYGAQIANRNFLLYNIIYLYSKWSFVKKFLLALFICCSLSANFKELKCLLTGKNYKSQVFYTEFQRFGTGLTLEEAIAEVYKNNEYLGVSEARKFVTAPLRYANTEQSKAIFISVLAKYNDFDRFELARIFNGTRKLSGEELLANLIEKTAKLKADHLSDKLDSNNGCSLKRFITSLPEDKKQQSLEDYFKKGLDLTLEFPAFASRELSQLSPRNRALLAQTIQKK